jgi:hypothetical protein
VQPSVPLEQLPRVAADASLSLVEEMRAVFGADLMAAWFHGGTTFADRPRQIGDLDLSAVIAGAAPAERDPAIWSGDPESRPSRIYRAHRAIGRAHGIAFDVIYLLSSEMGGGEPPTDAFNVGRPITDWPVLRAHLLAGQYVHLHGLDPERLVVPPTRAELEHALDRELEHLERHVFEGDAADPYEATYAIWNGCRILYTLQTGSPVVSKRSAGDWGLSELPAIWHQAIRAAGRAYDGEASAEDIDILGSTMAPFVEMVRGQLPATEPRPPGPPRWS